MCSIVIHSFEGIESFMYVGKGIIYRCYFVKEEMGTAGFHFRHRYLLTDRFDQVFIFAEPKYHLSLLLCTPRKRNV